MLDWRRSITEWMGQGESLVCSFMLGWLRSITEWMGQCESLVCSFMLDWLWSISFIFLKHKRMVRAL